MEDNFLLENFDFIEEATPFSTVPLEFQDVSELDISESKSEKSPYKLIGKVKGCMAPIGVYSRNHRLYENDHWIKVLQSPDLQERIANRRLFGMPSHMQKRIDDEDFREGRISHIVSCLEVREDNNGKPFLYGEFDILDTPAGRILKAMYEGGAGIYVSTRAAGKLEPIVGDPVNKRVCSNSYWLGGIDCVLEPGFLQARPAFEAISSDPVQPQIHESAEETSTTQEPTSEASEITELKSQIDKLAKIVEKVVDDVYEEPTHEGDVYEESTSESISDELEKRQDLSAAKKDQLQAKAEVAQKAEEEAAAKREGRSEQEILDKRHKTANKEGEYATRRRQNASEALVDFVNLMASTNISEDKFSEILDIIAASKKENK